MGRFFAHFKALHLWLLGNGAALGLFLALRHSRGVMNALAQGFSMPLERFLGRLCALVPFSVAELCYALGVMAAALWLGRSLWLLGRTEYRLELVYRRVLLLGNALLSFYAAFCLLWGVNFYADSFCDKSGIYPQRVAYEDLVAVTRYFAGLTAQYAGAVPRDGEGACDLSRREILDLAPELYQGMYEEFPFLYLETDPRPKGIFFSPVMSAMNVTGLYFPFTGESNLNMDFPTALFPATVAHELAHRRGVASEQQCNFLAVLASTRSPDPAYRYSGALMAFVNLSNALYTASPEAWREIRLSLPAEVEADLRRENLYWQRYAGRVSRASDKVYDAMLKGYGDELGTRSYGAVTDLLVAYYKDRA